MINRYASAALAALLLAACGGDADEAEKLPEPQAQAPANPNGVAVAWERRRPPGMTPEELERARMDMSWQELVQLDTTGSGARPAPIPKSGSRSTRRR